MHMGNGRRGLTVKWAAGILGMLFVGGGNILGTALMRILYTGGVVWEDASFVRWGVTIAVWAVGVALSAVTYALGAALERMDAMEMWILSLDTAVRNQQTNA